MPPAARKRCAGADCRRLAKPRGKYCDDHGRKPPARKGLIGCAEPRLWSRPRRPLTSKTTRGYEVIEFAKMIGEPLLPWQEWVVIHALQLNPDGTYRFRTVLIIVARQNGKSHLLRILTLWRMYLDGAKRILGVAQDVALARDQWKMCQDLIQACPELQAEWENARNVNGDEMFWLTNGARYAIKAANGRAGRGGSNDMVIIDELREQHDDKGWAAVSKTTMARRSGQVWAMSNAGSDASVVLNDLRAKALAGNEPALGIFEWSAPDGCELDDTAAWRQANPGLGHVITEEAIRSARGTDRPAIFRTEVLCQRVSQLDNAIDLERWDACADVGGAVNERRKRGAACFDVALDGDHATLAVATVLADGRVRVEIAAAWRSTDEARRELGPLLDELKPIALGWYPSGPGAALATVLRGRKGLVDFSGGKASEACQELADLVKAFKVVHSADPLLDAHVRGAGKAESGDAWRFVRRGAANVDAAYAAAGAIKLALELPQPMRARIRML